MLSKAFCDGTKDDFKTILSKAARKIDGKSLDVNLLLSCLQETLDFEQWLERRFATDVCTRITDYYYITLTNSFNIAGIYRYFEHTRR